MHISQEEYSRMSDKACPKSKSAVNIPMAFLSGGLICAIAQVLTELFVYLGLDKDDAGTWTSITLVAVSAVLTGMGWYGKIARHAGAGTLVPITGFSNAVSSAAVESRSEGLVTGVGAKIFTIAGPVILYGCTASVIYGTILFLIEN